MSAYFVYLALLFFGLLFFGLIIYLIRRKITPSTGDEGIKKNIVGFLLFGFFYMLYKKNFNLTKREMFWCLILLIFMITAPLITMLLEK